MNQARIERAAALLVDARMQRRLLSAFAADASPTTMEEALAVQREVARRIGAAPGAWKVGAPPRSSTTYAPIYAADIHASPATIRVADYPGLQIEGEVAFSMGRDLPSGGRPYSAAQVAEAVASACAAIEVASTRLADFPGASNPEKVADNLGNGGFVYGKGAPTWRKLDIGNLHVTLAVNGKSIVDKTGGKPGDDPFTLLVWMANNLGWGNGLKAGDIITTGSWTGLLAVKPGDDIAISFDGLGDVRMRCV